MSAHCSVCGTPSGKGHGVESRGKTNYACTECEDALGVYE